MSTFHWRSNSLLILGSLLIGSSFSYGQNSFQQNAVVQPISAQRALDTISGRYGPDSVAWVAELQGADGQPQPSRWEVLTYDQRSPGLLRRFMVSPGIAQDGGAEQRRYPSNSPAGYFNNADLGVDSVAAFTIAEAAANQAKIGFDRCDYFLKVREYSRETVWKLDLIDAAHRLVGSVFISGSNGEVLRTIWVQRDTISGYPRISDSVAPGSQSQVPATGVRPTDEFSINNRPPIPPAPAQPIQPMTQPQPIAAPSVTAIPRGSSGNSSNNSSSIFKEFPRSGGGTTPNNPNGTGAFIPQPPITPGGPAPAPEFTITPAQPQIPSAPRGESIPIPQPEPIVRAPVVNTRPDPAPPINVPSGSGSSARIPPPTIPQ